ncbi:ATP synthase F1 subunit delta [Crocinitomix algicola]|uniref:ATP synthase F1 subunit delta n=1 Tax=Crocinitomix algicola TaxID=1740263 RepID=UPI00082B42F5|nr:ATP synthase F1 subunit delta [Crocinitomix algicola]
MSVTRVAYRYAQSLIDLATEKKVVEEVYADMNQLSTVCKDSQDFKNLLNSPVITGQKKLEVFKAIFDGKVNSATMDLLNLIVKNERENVLPAIAKGFIELYKKSNGIHEVFVTSAHPLDQATKDKIVEKLKAGVNGTIELHEKVDPELIGGFVVRIDDQQIDASIASQLSNLKNVLLN